MNQGHRQLNPDVLAKLSRWFIKFGDILQGECDSHALLRGEFFSTDTGNICLDLLGSDARGNFSREGIMFLDNGELKYSRRLKLSNLDVVSKSIREVLGNVLGLGIDISKLYFEFNNGFVKGLLALDPDETDGSYIMYLMSSKSSDHSLGIHEAKDVVGEDIAEDWQQAINYRSYKVRQNRINKG